MKKIIICSIVVLCLAGFYIGIKSFIASQQVSSQPASQGQSEGKKVSSMHSTGSQSSNDLAVDPSMLKNILQVPYSQNVNIQLSETTMYIIKKVYPNGKGLDLNDAIFGFDALVAKNRSSQIQDVFTQDK